MKKVLPLLATAVILSGCQMSVLDPQSDTAETLTLLIYLSFGLGWMILLMVQFKQSLPRALFVEKQKIFNYYWHFVDLIWVLIILIVYVPYLFQ